MIKHLLIGLMLVVFSTETIASNFFSLSDNARTMRTVENMKGKRYRNFKISLTGGYFTTGDYNFGTGGLAVELFVGKHMSLNYTFDLGMTLNNRNHFYYHGAAGATAGSLFIGAAIVNSAVDEHLDEALATVLGRDVDLSSNLTAGLGITGVILLLIPEGISYNIDMGKHISLSPYINPLGIDYIASKDIFGQNLLLSVEYGVRAGIYFNNKRFISPEAGIKTFYGTGKSGLSLGFAYGYYF